MDGYWIPVTADNYSFDIFSEFVIVASPLALEINVSLGNKCRISFSNSYYYGLHKQLSSRDLSYDKNSAHPPSASLWRRGMDAIRHWRSSLEGILEKNCMTFSTMLTLCSVLTSCSCATSSIWPSMVEHVSERRVFDAEICRGQASLLWKDLVGALICRGAWKNVLKHAKILRGC